jgi:hypothetical protein
MVIKPNQAGKIVEYLQKEQPALIEDAIKQVEKPEAYYQFFITIPEIFEKFCQKRNLKKQDIKGKRISRENIQERLLFIAVILKLYSPAIFKTTVSYSVEDGLRHNLYGLLHCNKEWISQQVDGIGRLYNQRFNDSYRVQVDDTVDYIKTQVSEYFDVEEEVKPEIELFQ